MGLAASQGRLLLLTARKSDLEFRAQQISQARLVLAREQEGVAKNYADAVANTILKMTVIGEEGTEEIDFTALNFLQNQDSFGDSKYRLVGPNGQPITLVNGQVSGGGLSSKQRQLLTAEGNKTNADSILKYLMETGVIRLQKKGEDVTNAQGQVTTPGEWGDASIAGETKFRETLYDTDDKKAETAYNADMLRIKVKDQQLELDIKGIETQHKAIETEYESVQKVIQKNIEVSFKIFS